MQKAVKILALLILVVNISNSQVSQDWVQRYNGTENNTDEAMSIAVDGSGNVYVAGYTFSGGSSLNYVTVKYNSTGVQQWVQKFPNFGTLDDKSPSIAIDNSGNVIIAGRIWSGTTNKFDFLVIKYNTDGVQQWTKSYNGPGNLEDIVNAVTTDVSGNIYVIGTAWGSGTFPDFTTIKYNSLGVQQWASSYNKTGSSTEEAAAIEVDASGNVYVTGSTYDSPHTDYATVKYNSSGTQQWAVNYVAVGNGINKARDLEIDPSGNVYVTGHSSNFGTNSDYVTIKYNSAGVQQWLKRYNGPASLSDEAYSMGIDISGNIYVTGISAGSGSGQDYVTIKYNSAGDEQWVSRYNGPGNGTDNAFALALDNTGNVYVTGNSKGTTIQGEYATIKYNSAGAQQWEQRYEGPGTFGGDYPYAIAVDVSGSVYITGMSYGDSSYQDFATIKYSQPIGIQNISDEVPERFSLSQNYPNPFNPSTNFEFQIADFGFVSIKIFDITGKEVETLVYDNLSAGVYKADWNASGYSSGIYFYKLETGAFSETRKMMLVK